MSTLKARYPRRWWGRASIMFAAGPGLLTASLAIWVSACAGDAPLDAQQADYGSLSELLRSHPAFREASERKFNPDVEPNRFVYVGQEEDIQVRIPTVAHEPRILSSSLASLHIRLNGASDTRARLVGRDVIFESALGRGAHSVHRPMAKAEEEFLVLPDATGPTSVSYSLSSPEALALKLNSDGSVEASTTTEVPSMLVWRMSPPVVIDNRGQRFTPTVKLANCSVLLADGGCVLSIDWTSQAAQFSYPAVLDPNWTVESSTQTNKTEFLVTRDNPLVTSTITLSTTAGCSGLAGVV